MQRMHIFWLCLLAAWRCDAAIYQWTDGTGTVQFSDRPPQQAVEVIERRDIEAAVKAAPPPPAAAPRRARDKARAHTGGPRKAPKEKSSGSTREQARQRCDKLRRRIDTTQSQLRAGYSASRGIRLNARLREDRDKLYRDCRY